MLDITNNYSNYHNKAGIYMISANVFSPKQSKLRTSKFLGDANLKVEGVFQTKTYIGQSENIGGRLSDHMTFLKNGLDDGVGIAGFANTYKTNLRGIKLFLLENITEFINLHKPNFSQQELLNIFESYFLAVLPCNNRAGNSNINYLIKGIDYLLSKNYTFKPSCNLININNKHQIIYRTPSFEQLNLSSKINKDCIFTIPVLTKDNSQACFNQEITYYADANMDINLCNSLIYINLKSDNTLHQNPLLCHVNFRDGLYCGLTVADMTGDKKQKSVSISQATIAIKYKKVLDRSKHKKMIDQQKMFLNSLGKNDTRTKFVDKSLLINSFKNM